MIKVEVRLFATLRRYGPQAQEGGPIVLSLPPGAPVRQLFEALGMPQDIVKTVFVNGIVREESYALADGDQVGLFPPIAGGGSQGPGPRAASKKARTRRSYSAGSTPRAPEWYARGTSQSCLGSPAASYSRTLCG